MKEESDGPDVVAIGRREATTAAGAAAATVASRQAASALAGINPSSPSLSSEQQQRQALQEEPLPPLLTKNQRHKLRQKRCRLAKRLTMQQGDSTEDPLVVADVRMPTATAATTAAAFLTAPLLSAAGQKPSSLVLLSGGSGASTQDRVAVDVFGLGGEREGTPAATAAEPATTGAEEGEEGSFPIFQQRHSRHKKFHDDEEEEEEEGERKKRQKVDVDEQRKKEKRKGKKKQGSEDEEEAAAPSLLPSLPFPPPAAVAAAPCRVDLSLAAATIAVALRSPQEEEEGNNKRSSNAAAAASFLSRPAPRGNYSRYYGYRLGLSSSPSDPASAPLPPRLLSPAHEALYGAGAADPRLRALLPYLSLLRGRRVLDVGCNGGVLTLALAAAAGASGAVGVDADARLVRSARARCLRQRESAAEWERALRAGAGKAAATEEGTAAGGSSSPPSPPFLLPEPGGRSLAGRRAAARACSRALRATTFRHEDFVAAASELREGEGGKQEELFGAALCLSVTKWVHLFHGDSGIERLFARLSRRLTRGAHLVLEPQPWRSYRRAVRKEGVKEALLLNSNSNSTSSTPRSLDSLKIKPDDFVSLLEEPRHAFTLVRSLGAPEGAAPGFDRPLLLFRKK